MFLFLFLFPFPFPFLFLFLFLLPGCCFGTYRPPPWMNATPGAGIASSGEILLQGSGYRTLLISGARDVRFYAHNTEQDFGALSLLPPLVLTDLHTLLSLCNIILAFSSEQDGCHVIYMVTTCLSMRTKCQCDCPCFSILHRAVPDFYTGNAHTEIRDSYNVSLYGTKSEGNNVDIWIANSDLVSVHGYGTIA